MPCLPLRLYHPPQWQAGQSAPLGSPAHPKWLNCPLDFLPDYLPQWKVRRLYAPGKPARKMKTYRMASTTARRWVLRGRPNGVIGGEVGRERRPLRVAQPRGIGWGGSFHSLSSFCFGKTTYAMEAPVLLKHPLTRAQAAIALWSFGSGEQARTAAEARQSQPNEGGGTDGTGAADGSN